jgi:hypothetical protein
VAIVLGARAWYKHAHDSSTVSAHARAELAVLVVTNPPGARITLDGEPAGQTPLDLRVPKDDTDHTVRVQADGYVDKIETVRYSTSQTLVIELEAAPAAAAAAAAAEPKPKVTPSSPQPRHVSAGPHPGSPVHAQRSTAANRTPDQPAPTTAPPDPARGAGPATREFDKDDPWKSQAPK